MLWKNAWPGHYPKGLAVSKLVPIFWRNCLDFFHFKWMVISLKPIKENRCLWLIFLFQIYTEFVSVSSWYQRLFERSKCDNNNSKWHDDIIKTQWVKKDLSNEVYSRLLCWPSLCLKSQIWMLNTVTGIQKGWKAVLWSKPRGIQDSIS